jgi:hypothetical protein
VPGVSAFDDDEIGLGVEGGLNGGDSLVGDFAFELLAFAVMDIEGFGNRESFGKVLCEEEVKRGFGGLEASSGIEPRCKLETNFVDAQG